ncbi:hypothetical protein OESDEN_11962 [Oesophagostomum dentatum]|uniref:glucuronosyltransferase n=1 Tax=Oesophagostomum dentatum TaxID=61180 RepID=A0A0B1SSH3_OESDE|nr:hypothetical protein OESDEN_11962 [Oesophagostomum dentatum]
MGLNSFLEASIAGVPMVAIPLFADQIHNAHSAVYRGTTVTILPQHLTSENVKNAIKKILYEPSYQENARHISQMMRTKPERGREMFIEWLEFAAANKGLHKILNLPGNDISAFEYYCIDCAILLLSAFLVITYLVWKLILALFPILSRMRIMGIKLKTN